MKKKYKSLILGIGPIRSGTSWLFENLRQCEGLTFPKLGKESNFWMDKECCDATLEEYVNLFEDPNNSVLVDISPNYIAKWKNLIPLQSYFESIHVIIFLRNSLEKLTSISLYLKMQGNILKTADEALDFELVSENIFISKAIPEIKECFSNIYFFDFNDIAKRPEFVMRDLCKKISISEPSNDLMLRKKVNPSFVPRSKAISLVVTRIQTFLRFKVKLTALADYFWRAPWVRMVLGKAPDNELIIVSKELRNKLEAEDKAIFDNKG